MSGNTWKLPKIWVAVAGAASIAAASSFVTARVIGKPEVAPHSAPPEGTAALTPTPAAARGTGPVALAPVSSPAAEARPEPARGQSGAQQPARPASARRAAQPRAGHVGAQPAGEALSGAHASPPAAPALRDPDLERALAEAQAREWRLREQASLERERRMAAEDEARAAEARLDRERALRDRDWARARRSQDFELCVSSCRRCNEFVGRYSWGEDVDHARRLDRACRSDLAHPGGRRFPDDRESRRRGGRPEEPPVSPSMPQPVLDLPRQPLTPFEPPGGVQPPDRPARPVPLAPADVRPPEQPDPVPPGWRGPTSETPRRPDPRSVATPAPSSPPPIWPTSPPPFEAPPTSRPIAPEHVTPQVVVSEPAEPAQIREGLRDPPGDAREP
jgi:hypothetical protein